MRWDQLTIRAAVPAAVVAIIAAVVSYSHIVALCLAAGQPPADARLMPFAIDGLITAGVVILLAGSLLGWLAIGPGVAATLFANIMSGVADGPLGATVAAWPAVAFALVSYVLERWFKSRAKPAVTTGGACGHVVAGDLDGVVTAAYLHGRDCLGEAPSIRSLAETYEVSRPRVTTLVGSLNGHAPALGAGDARTGLRPAVP